MLINLREWFELDESKKDANWGNMIITYLRQHMQPVINDSHAREGIEYLFGDHSMEEVKAMFKDPKKAGVNFAPVAIMEKIRNIFISEMRQMGIIINVRATDPTADEDKMHDVGLIKRKKHIEGLMSYLYQSIGEPAYKLEDEERISGKKPYKGNGQEFDSMGLNPEDPEDVDFFLKHFHRFDHEIALGDCIEFIMTYNEVDELISYWVNDILSKKAIGGKMYVSDETGAVKIGYLAPESISALQGRRKDYKDATCIGYEQNVTVAEMIEIIGNEFDYDRDMNELLRAVNYAYKSEYTGVHSDNKLYYGQQGNCCSYSQFMQFQISLGYIEFKSTNAKAYKVTDKNTFGNYSVFPISLSQEVSADSRYRKESEYQQCTYKAYYLAYSPSAQRLYKWGKLNYQYFEGAEDQISNYSIFCYKEVGKSVVEIAKPFIQFIEKNFKKFEYMVVRAKPPGRAYNYESLVKIAMQMFPEANQRVGVETVLGLFYESANEIYTLPEIDGQAMGGGTNVNYDIPHGLSKSIVEFKNNIDWGIEQINSLIGISPLRDAYSPKPREAVGLQEKALDYSQHATYYIPGMVTNMLNRMAVRGCYYVQDIITFKDKNTIPYKFFCRALGYLTVEKISTLERVAAHRYGIFVESLDQGKEVAELKQVLFAALQNKAIDTAQYLLIKGIKNPKKAYLIFAYMENRNKKLAMAAVAQQKEAEVKAGLALEAAKQDTLKLKIHGELAVEDKKGEWFFKAHAYSADLGMQKKVMELENKNATPFIENAADRMSTALPAVVPPPAAPPMPTQGMPAQQPMVPAPQVTPPPTPAMPM